MRSRIFAAAWLGLAGLSASGPAKAQPAHLSSVAKQMDPRAVVTEVRRLIRESYVLPEKRPIIDAALAKSLASGRYNISDPAVLAERINADLEKLGHDKHLNFEFNPQDAKLRSGGEQAAPDAEAFARQVYEANHGIMQLRVLPGNIRYMAYDNFMWLESESAAALDLAMQFLAGGDAAIIDLRRNGGGAAPPVQYILSHFLPPNRPLFTYHFSGRGLERDSTLDKLRAPRMIGRPLYVLISNSTASAAEAFAGAVSGTHIGELIGETTNGAGYRNQLVPIDNRFVLSVSVGRVIIDATGRDWEAVGIAPTTNAPVDQALEVAQVRALRRLLLTATPTQKRKLEAAAEVLEARINPINPGLPLAKYAGSFGERKILLERDALTFQRLGGVRHPLIAVGANKFAFGDDPLETVTFTVVNDAVTSLKLLRGDGSYATAARTR